MNIKYFLFSPKSRSATRPGFGTYEIAKAIDYMFGFVG